ncbi:MAG: dTMP kinase [Leptospiraceae bacterium]|nr:dTMP kinase [Leptospiraceae bacterium]MDW8307540.1 dTMP kinase [Leptospiraceae bacterium]
MPLFVVIEGADGSGKTTLAALLKERFFPHNKVVMFAEPTNETNESRKIRQILQNHTSLTEDIRLELLQLFYLDRLWDIEGRIRPALQRGQHVLLDRYFLSTAAYQARDEDEAREILDSYLKDCRMLWPDLVLYLDASLECLIARLTASRRGKDLFEQESYLKKVLLHYEKLLPTLPFPVRKINAEQNIQAVYEEALAYLKPLLNHENSNNPL